MCGKGGPLVSFVQAFFVNQRGTRTLRKTKVVVKAKSSGLRMEEGRERLSQHLAQTLGHILSAQHLTCSEQP